MIDKIELIKVTSKFKGTRSRGIEIIINKVQKLTDTEVDAINEEFGHWDDFINYLRNNINNNLR